ncbi:MAG: hypothetical protein QOF84_4762 [Streptomyces sp.]|nr:hypothetical protein [Streptomyces sp.]
MLSHFSADQVGERAIYHPGVDLCLSIVTLGAHGDIFRHSARSKALASASTLAPVTAGVPDAQQHQHPALTSLREGLVAPGPSVDGIVGVLKEVRRGGTAESIGHVPSLAHGVAR